MAVTFMGAVADAASARVADAVSARKVLVGVRHGLDDRDAILADVEGLVPRQPAREHGWSRPPLVAADAGLAFSLPRGEPGRVNARAWCVRRCTRCGRFTGGRRRRTTNMSPSAHHAPRVLRPPRSVRPSPA